jgi:hypothetical protein
VSRCRDCGGPIIDVEGDLRCDRCGLEVVTPSRRVVAIAAADVHREQVSWLAPGRVPLGMVTVLAGIGGLGKSTWTCVLAAENDGPTLIATAEDSPETTVRPRLEAVQADLDRVHFVHVRTDEGLEDGLTIPDDVAQLEELVAKIGATLVVVDPLVAHLPGHIDSHKDQSVRRALAPLYRLAQAQRCAVVTLIHLNKAQGLAPLARLSGSGGFGNAARSVLLLDRDPDDEDNGRRRVLAHIKCNVGPEMPSLLYEIEPVVLMKQDGEPMVETSKLTLLGESEHDGRALLAVPTGEARSALDDAIAFLEEELGDGERHPAGDVKRLAQSLGHSHGTLQTARRKLGVRTEKAGFGGGWEVWLPKSQPAKSQTTSDSSHQPHNDASLRLVDDSQESASRESDSSAKSTDSHVRDCRVCGTAKTARVVAGVTYLKCGHLFVEGAVS